MRSRPRALPLHTLIDALVRSTQLPIAQLLRSAGITGQTLRSLRGGPTRATASWMRLLSALGARAIIETPMGSWSLPAQRPTTMEQERAWRAWRQQRFLNHLGHIQRSQLKLKRMHKERLARANVVEAEAKVRARLGERSPGDVRLVLDVTVDGLRDAVRALAEASGVYAEDLALCAGLRESAVAAALRTAGDGRLSALHRLLTVLAARVTIERGSGGSVHVRSADLVDRPASAVSEVLRAPRRGGAKHASRVRSSLPHDDILRRWDAGESIGVIARDAGISRQRVYAIARTAGRDARRATRAVAAAADAVAVLAGV